MSNTLSPYHVYAAVRRILPELPDLVGAAAWPSVSSELDMNLERLRQSRDPLEAMRISVAVQRLLRDYPSARQRLMTEIAVQSDVQQALENDLLEIARELGIEVSDQLIATALVNINWTATPESLPTAKGEAPILPLLEENERAQIEEGGERGVSVKFSNLWLDSNEIPDIVSNMTFMGADIAFAPSGVIQAILLVAGILLTIRTVKRARKVTLTEHEASVFWALIQAQHCNRPADTETIRLIAREERAKFKLGAQSEKEFNTALERLEQLHCIELVSGQWQIVEHYTIKS